MPLAERRTLTFGNRKILLGTPIFEDTSAVLELKASDSAFSRVHARLVARSRKSCGRISSGRPRSERRGVRVSALQGADRGTA